MQDKVPCLLSRRFSFITMTLLLAAFFFVEVVVGYVTNSMALIADSFHMLSDVASLIVGYLALKYSNRDGDRDTYTYGYARAEVLGALVNAVFLVALCFSILIEALKRLVILEEIENPMLVFCVGAVGLVVNLFGMFLFHQTGHGHTHGGMSHSHSHGSDEKENGHSHLHEGNSHSHSHGNGGNLHSHSHGNGAHSHNHSHSSNGYSHSMDSPEAKESSSLESIEEEDTTKRKADVNNTKQKSQGSPHKENTSPRESNQDASPRNKTEKEQENFDHRSNDSSVNLEELERKRIPQAKSAGHLNIRGVYLHILGDALGSIIVMISALIIMFAHGQWTLYVDPSMSIIMVVIILKTSIPLLMETSKILMNSVPHHIQINQMREKLLKQLPQIKNVHELHVWQLAGDKIIASAHVKFESEEDYEDVALKIKEFFHNEGIHSTTIQIEFEKDDNVERRGPCMIVCSLDSACDDMMCCKPEHMKE